MSENWKEIHECPQCHFGVHLWKSVHGTMCDKCGWRSWKAEAPARYDGLISALKAYTQGDMEGIMCLVSRQAVEEAIEILSSLPGRSND